MRVLHVIPSIGPSRGGPSIAIASMVRGLSTAGVVVHVATTNDDDASTLDVPFNTTVERDGGFYHFFPRQTRSYIISRPLRDWVGAEVKQFDVVHTHAVFTYTSNAAARVAQRAGVPTVIRPLGTLAPYGLRQHRAFKTISLALIERRLLRRAAAVHCTSASEAEEIRQLSSEWRTVVIPLGFEHESVAARSRAWVEENAPQFSDRTLVLFLSRLDPKKGIELLCEAMQLLKARNAGIGLVIAGGGDASYATALKRRASSLRLDGDVLWTGPVQGAEKRALFAAADLFVLPSHAENFGIAAVEALAQGVPAIVSDQVGIHGEIAAAGAGLVVQRGPEQIAGAIQQLALDEARRCEMGKRAAALARETFSQQSMTSGLLDLYRGVCA